MQQSVRNVCAKFKVDALSRFRTGARQVFITQKLLPSEIPLTMKTATSNLWNAIAALCVLITLKDDIKR